LADHAAFEMAEFMKEQGLRDAKGNPFSKQDAYLLAREGLRPAAAASDPEYLARFKHISADSLKPVIAKFQDKLQFIIEHFAALPGDVEVSDFDYAGVVTPAVAKDIALKAIERKAEELALERLTTQITTPDGKPADLTFEDILRDMIGPSFERPQILLLPQVDMEGNEVIRHENTIVVAKEIYEARLAEKEVLTGTAQIDPLLNVIAHEAMARRLEQMEGVSAGAIPMMVEGLLKGPEGLVEAQDRARWDAHVLYGLAGELKEEGIIPGKNEREEISVLIRWRNALRALREAEVDDLERAKLELTSRTIEAKGLEECCFNMFLVNKIS